MGSLLLIGSLLLADVSGAGTSSATSGSRFNPIENLFQPLARPQQQQQQQQHESENNTSNKETTKFKIPYYGADPNAPTAEEREAERSARRERSRQRRAKVADAMKKVRPDLSKIEKVSHEALQCQIGD